MMLAVAAAKEQQGEGCSDSAKRCSNVTISHPFWLRHNELERACGVPDFEVTCFHNTTPVLRSSVPIGYGLSIIDIDYGQRSLRVADAGKLELLSNDCLPVWNTSAKVGASFMIAPDNLNLVLYRCTEAASAVAVARRDRELVRTRMKCGDGSEVLVRAGGRYGETGGYGGYEGCDAAVTPVLGAHGKANASDYERLINYGFLLTWKPPRKLARQIIS